jgi:hypothetical protein
MITKKMKAMWWMRGVKSVSGPQEYFNRSCSKSFDNKKSVGDRIIDDNENARDDRKHS